MKFKLIILSLLLTYSFSATITGSISDNENGTPLVGASVYLEGTQYGTTTNEFGQYLIMDVPIGQYSLIGKYLGYKDLKMNIDIEF